MGSIRDFFVNMGIVSEDYIDSLSDDMESQNAKKAAYSKIEEQFDAMTKDGTLDAREKTALMNQLRAAGLDTGALSRLYGDVKDSDAAVRGDKLADFGKAFKEELGKARAGADDKIEDDRSEANKAQTFASIGYSSAADWNKKSHDAYMAIIGNMKG
ncbi:MAG: hypothetical protein U1E65_11330 [Myxococcota bacterium]